MSQVTDVPIRVAQVMGHMAGGGVEATIMNHYRYIDRDRVQFDFIIDEDSTTVPEEEIKNLGGRIFIVPKYTKVPQYLKACEAIFRQEKPTIVHSNINALSPFPLSAAKRAGISVRIAHSHSTANPAEITKTTIKSILRPFSKRYPTHLAACSHYAAQWLFGKKATQSGAVHIINNAIDLNRFLFNAAKRRNLRNSLHILDNQLVIGQVGRFCFQKNQLFTIEIFAEVLRQRPDAILIFVGEGTLKKEAIAKAQQLGIDKSIHFLGQRDEVNEWYQAFDVLAFPSQYEGLGMAAIEAQAADLHVVSSLSVPREAEIIPGLVDFISIHEKEAWVKTLVETSIACSRKNLATPVRQAGYDIKESAAALCSWYTDISFKRQ